MTHSRMTPALRVLHVLMLTHCVQCAWQNYAPYKQRNSSVGAGPALRTKINPLLARLYAAKRTVLQTASSIDSMIAEAIQKERFQHEYAPYKLPMTATFPYIEPDIVGGPKSVGAAIGAHGGKWYSDALGASAGQIGAGMVGTRRDQAYYSPIPPGNVLPAQTTAYAPPFQRISHVVTNYIRPQKDTRPLATPPKKGPSLPPRTSKQASAKPTTSRSTKDPVEDMPSLGNPRDFENRCTVLKLTFEHFKKGQVIDDSFQKNDVRLSDGVTVTDQNTVSGHSAQLGKKGNIVLARDFKGKPRKAVGISMWVKLNDVKGNYSLLRAVDGTDNATHYNLGVHGGKGSWVHYDDAGKELFRVESGSSDIRAGKWHNIVANYNSLQKKATLWVDGRLVGQKNGISGPLSQKWSKVVVFGGKTAGLLDNVFMFRCPLDRTKIVALYVAAANQSSAHKKSQIQRQHVTNEKM